MTEERRRSTDYVAGVVAGEMKVVHTILAEMKADTRHNHSENKGRLDSINLSLANIISTGQDHDSRLISLEAYNVSDVRPAVEKVKKAKWWLLGAVSASGVASSPGWFPKVVAILGGVFH